MNIRHKFILPMLIAALVGCASTGVKVSDEKLDSFKKGESTVSQVLAALGQPTTTMKMGDGTVMLQYAYSEASVRAASFIPVVGLVAGGSDIHVSTAVLRFDAEGKLIDVTRSSSQYGTGTGVSAGQVSTTPIQQPRQ